MSIAIVIPARWASTRLPEKMLLSETGWPLIRHTYEQAKKARLAQKVVIATDDERIFQAVRSFGGEVVMTDPNHPTGTDRLAEVATNFLPNADLIVNVQGDEPELEPEKIDLLITLAQASDCAMATLVTPFPSHLQSGAGSPLDPNCVKAVLGSPISVPTTLNGGEASPSRVGYQALYFSRSLVPYPRDSQGCVLQPENYFLHLGIYAYHPRFLQEYVKLPQTPLEITEKLEQLRILEHGYRIVAGVVTHATAGVDTRADYEAFVKRHQQRIQANDLCITS